MSRKRRKKYSKNSGMNQVHPGAKTSVIAIGTIGFAIVLLLAAFAKAGPAGEVIFKLLDKAFGWGYYLVPLILIVLGLGALSQVKRTAMGTTFVGAGFFIAAGLGIIDIIYPDKGGVVGSLLGSLEALFGYAASLVVNFTVLVAAVVLALNVPIKLTFKLPKSNKEKRVKEVEPEIIMPEALATGGDTKEDKKRAAEESKQKGAPAADLAFSGLLISSRGGDYKFPPLSLLKSHSEKPTVGDLRANANIIKRTLDSFGIPVEMGEITIGPKVTRYTLKPADGIKLSRILSLNQDLSLALAAHPIRIEAPIPGKSLVGVEIPNIVGSIVRLGSLLAYPEFKTSPNLNFPLGRDVSGEPTFVDLSRMPHLLIAGATGSGKSVIIHAFILSLLYKNSPETLRLLMIDPKRVELSIYEGIPHLITPVITEGKKAVGALKFVIQEMENRYETLLKAGSRDITSYNKGRKGDFMPYLVVIIDELADLMTTFGREVEGAIVRLAQMARATGIHLVVSTQRPSVEVITGLIKANITSRIALQVASQIDSRTILDNAGAEKLLGGGDMLFISSDLSKPRRIQGSFISEEEIGAVAKFVKRENPSSGEVEFGGTEDKGLNNNKFEDFLGDDVDDDMYEEALEVVKRAGKASASLLQRRLRVGYARAARLLDIMEDKGVIGPADGARPREVYMDFEKDEGEYSDEE
ncbi:MAG: hypothetical protein A3C03_00800 [Candidatus Colwellbacteria bacterium RIFCSPHIGHO2_02_FULL_45_17]|uniref:FtsK domain-containing protein n=1 Tax=Candidatus Colwellbacteria bacterium RIFCSPLOWO2_12_FULL_46_17 TaxID=1797695 RepID=A0A1G1ZBP3_9BACT|nr:MAG: hypothetical protein A3C03_00800 [Candidatus Colwellbacteria bacterium RIFCSPHIGHO2_02_FULL_45_17]OGY62071.1 MAG: hypothetical protein A3G58_01600 [Candidatus Colwellbacteria bacterium RIFCSPLOWO2_12_FULL_46_17]